MLYYIVHTKKIIRFLVCTLFISVQVNDVTPEVSAVGRDTENLSIDRVFKTTGIDLATMRIKGGMGMHTPSLTRENALALLKTYNKEPFHIQHALTVEAVMRWYANVLGFGEEADYWAQVGLLHDVDFEMYPEEHCVKAQELLKEAGVADDEIYSICCHGYGICIDWEPKELMENVLYAADELTGLIGAAALMRPSKSTKDMELKSLKKKFKDKKFAAGCSRDVIKNGADRLGWELDELLIKTLAAMQASEDQIVREYEVQVGN